MPGNPRPTFSPDDEIALMLSDLGEKGTATTQLPSQALEIEVADPLGGSLRYAYVAVAGAMSPSILAPTPSRPTTIAWA
jgi:hypothetical protein